MKNLFVQKDYRFVSAKSVVSKSLHLYKRKKPQNVTHIFECLQKVHK